MAALRPPRLEVGGYRIKKQNRLSYTWDAALSSGTLSLAPDDFCRRVLGTA